MQLSRIYNRASTCYHSFMKETGSKTRFGEALRNNGLKITPGRIEILSVLAKYHIPLSAEDISKKIRFSKIDRATVYRTLSSLVTASIIKKIHLGTSSECFELNNTHHHHIVCTDCGRIEDFEACNTEDATRNILKHSAFQSISTHSLELFGICKKCSQA